LAIFFYRIKFARATLTTYVIVYITKIKQFFMKKIRFFKINNYNIYFYNHMKINI